MADNSPRALAPALLAAAECGQTAEVLQLYDEGGYRSIDTRSVYQSTLLHTAAKHGHVELARALLQRGAQVNLLDYGGMRRSPLHWACHGGHVALVEVLLEADADTSADGRSWSKLVQGSRCGSLIPKDQPTESAVSLCRTNAVRLALTRPTWHPSIHVMWPPRFKDAARLLLLVSSSYPSGQGAADCCCAARGSTTISSTEKPGSSPYTGLRLAPDTLLEVLRHAAYPVSAWI